MRVVLYHLRKLDLREAKIVVTISLRRDKEGGQPDAPDTSVISYAT